MHIPQSGFPSFKGILEQLNTLGRISNAFRSEHAHSWLTKKANSDFEGYTGLIAVPLLDHFGSFRIPVPIEAWGKATGWNIPSRIPGVRSGDFFKFPAEKFLVAEGTRRAFARLDAQQQVIVDDRDENRIRICRVRVSTDPEPQLMDGEFFLDLASTLWVLATHIEWRKIEGESLLRCLGETYEGHGTLFAGYANDVRKLTERSGERASQGPVLIGFAP